MKKGLGPKHFYVLCPGCAKRVRLDRASVNGYCPECVTRALLEMECKKNLGEVVKKTKEGEV